MRPTVLLALGAILLVPQNLLAQGKPAAKNISFENKTRQAITKTLLDRDAAFAAKDSAAYFAVCSADYAHIDSHQDNIELSTLKADTQKLFDTAKTVSLKSQIDGFRLEGNAALVETYESVSAVSYSHEWLEIRMSGYRRCRYRFVSEGGSWKLARTRVTEEKLTETPKLLEPTDPVGLTEIEKRVKNPEVRAAVAEILPLLHELALAEEQQDFRVLFNRLTADFAYVRLGKAPDNREDHVEQMTRAHALIKNEKVRYYLVGAERQENGDILLEVNQGLRYTAEPLDQDKIEMVLIANVNLLWTKQPGAWFLKREESFTADGFENGERIDFIQKEKNTKKK